MDELQNIQNLIYEIRGVKVMLDKDLAELYHVTTGNLNKAVKRNIRRFPSDFMFQLTKEEWDSLRFQIGILEVGRGKYTKFLPHAFTEQGLAMLSGVLNSDIAIDVNTIPEDWTANVCFGGKERDILFITASKSVYILKMHVRGVTP
jgi:hypothetical protein